MKWSALPAAVFIAGSVAMAQDQKAPSSQPSPAAQNANPPKEWTPTTSPPPIAKPKPKRKENQQDRIEQGVKSEQGTPGESASLETKEAAINGETKADRAANGGELTAAEKKPVNKEQNAASKSIYNKKHKPRTLPQAKPQS